MAELTIDMTYGTALYQAACDIGKEKEIVQEAESLVKIFKEESELDAFMKSPAIAASEKRTALEKIFEGKITEELLNFLCILVDKGRITHFDKMVKVCRNLYEHKEGVMRGYVYSVEALSKEKISRFEEETGKLLGEKVELENKIDTSLIGGVKVLVDGKIIDASIKNQLKKIALEIRV